ncbi:MAG: hypothetical protein H7834_02650 [Magnetococcus sp. YQC-9]
MSGGVKVLVDDHDTDHQLEEEIGVEVKKILRAEMESQVVTPARELSADEQQLFSDSFLTTSLELMIPSVAQERRLMALPKPVASKKRSKSQRSGKAQTKQGKSAKHVQPLKPGRQGKVARKADGKRSDKRGKQKQRSKKR